MTPLPFDYSRCKPAEPDKKCQNCKRWLGHPEQINSSGYVFVKNSRDPACIYIPVSLEKK